MYSIKNITHRALLLPALALLLATAHAQDARYLLVQEDWTVNADGTTDYHHRHEVQILRNRALTAYADKGETFVVYNPDLEEVSINEVYTLRADGSRVEMPQNAFVYQLPSECADCGRYSRMVELAMVHTGMEIGCTVVVDYTLHSRFGVVNQTLTLCKPDPIDRLEISIALPQEQKLGLAYTDPQLVAFSADTHQTANTFHLVANQVPPTFREAQMPDEAMMYPTLHFYNAPLRYSPAFDRQPLPEAADWARAVGGGRHTIGTAALIRDYVRDYIHLNPIDPIHLGYSHASASEVWQSGCGTVVDKAVLLAALLNSAGFEADVMEDNPDCVAVSLDTLTYALSVLDRGGVDAPYGKAYDAVFTADTTLRLDANQVLAPLADGFYAYRLPDAELYGYNAAFLSLSRQAPLVAEPCNLHHTVSLELPKGMKLVGTNGLLDGKEHKLAFDGLGSASLRVKQKGRTLTIERSLAIERTLVGADEYADYRRLVALWSSLGEVILQAKQ